MSIRSSILIVDAEECSWARVSEFNNFGVAVSFGVVIADLGLVEGDDDLFETILLVQRLVLDFILLLLFVMVCIVHFLVVILILFDGFVTFLLDFLDLLKLHTLFCHYGIRDWTLNKRWDWSSSTKLALSTTWTPGLTAQSVRASEQNSVVAGSNPTRSNIL